MKPQTNAPWWADIGDEAVTIRDKDGNAVWIAPRAEDVNEADRQAALAQLTAMAPELFINLSALVSVMRRSCNDDERESALEDAVGTLNLLTESGVFVEVAA